MPSPSSEPPRRLARPAVYAPPTDLELGFRYELAGLTRRAIAAYRAALVTARSATERIEVHLRLARVHRSASQWEDAIEEAREAVRLAQDAGADDLAAEAMNAEVGVHQLRGDFEAGDALALRALGRARAPRVRGMLLQNRGAIAAQRGDFAVAERLFAESVEAFRTDGYEYGTVVALTNGSAAARDAGDPHRAIDLGRQAAVVARRLHAHDLLGLALQNQAHALVDLGARDDAEELLNEAYGHFSSTDNALRMAECLEVMGAINSGRAGCHDVAVRCFSLAHRLAEQVGARPLQERLAQRAELRG
jgi:tetratricopeptide (TPR) repeat protein